jgi:hypothetical protein
MKSPSFAVALAIVVAAACSPANAPKGVTVADAWSMATPAGASVAAGYMRITNGDAEARRLVSGSTAVAERVEIHTMSMDGGVMRMRPLPEGLAIAGGETVELKPGGLHLMLVGLRHPLVQGESVPLTLTFDGGLAVEATLAVRAMGGGGHEH